MPQIIIKAMYTMNLEKNKKKAPNLQDVLPIAHRVIDQEIDAIKILKSSMDQNFEKAIDLILSRQGRIIVTGLGKSGAIGRKLAATLTSTGTASYFLHASEGIHGDLGIVHKNDVIICLSKSGNTDELNFLLPVFKKLNVPIISITSNLDSILAKHSNVILNLGVKEEACPHDLSPTSSTTAMMVLGDALAIVLLEKRGFTAEDFAFLHPAGSLGKRLLLRVDDIMESGANIPMVSAKARMQKAVLEMAEKRGICMVIDDNLNILGVMTTGDLNRLVEKTEQFFDIPVVEVMNVNPKIIQSNTLAYTAYRKMEEYRIIAMPVIDENKKLCGVIHLHDIMRAGIF
jgi:arabinose-5-phosphate isomerase